ncbi:MAG: CSLREA domain-containing protein, partial [Anaerolineae bacterium]|nr:CSLREA domain-containing protein [Anaerolineae bacterium]
NKPPVADAGPDQILVDSDANGFELVKLDAFGSDDPDGTIASYTWRNMSEQVVATGANPSIQLIVGVWQLELLVVDDGGAEDTDTVTITVNPQGSVCASITFTEFDSFGVAEFTVENPLTTPVLLDAFNIRWIQRAPGTMTLDRVTVGGTGPSDGATTVIWQSGAAGEDSTPPTYARSESSLGEGTWLTNYSFPGSSTTPLYLDFGGTDSALDAAFGVSAADFNGSEFQFDCGGGINQPPIADAGTDQTVTDSDGNGYESVNLHGSVSFDSDGTIASYTWRDSANQVVATGVNPTVQLAVGVWDLTLTVVDDDGSEDVDTVTITVEAVSQTYVINTTADPGDGTCDATECTLREAINASNTNEPKDTIAFDIPGTAPYIIAPETGMPEITDPVIIDGTTEPDYVDAPIIVLTGGSLLDADGVIGLNISAGDTTVRGLVINFFSDSAGIRLTTNGGNVIEGNYIGLAADGVTAQGNFVGIDIADAPGNSIGGAALANRNVIAGNDDAGLKITGSTSTGNRVQGNYIGVDVTGAAPVLNGEALNLSTSSLTTIGTDGDGTDDVAEGNVILGVSFLSGSSSNVIAGNLFGTDSTGTVDLAGGTLGLYLDAGSANNRIGTNGDLISDSAEANVIAGYDTGVTLLGATTTGNTIAGNSIGIDVTGSQNLGNTLQGILIDSDASNNVVTGNTIRFNGVGIEVVTGTGNHFSGNVIADQTGLGINLDEDGNAATIDAVTANDVGDADTGANNLQNFPELTSAVVGGGDVTLAGTLNSTANTQFRIEFFANAACDASGYGEGETYLGFAEVTTDGSGNALIDETLTASASLGQFITATAIDPGGNTSEFSACVEVEAGPLVAPTDLIASAESGTTIGLSWTDTSSDETGFSVERSLNGVDGWTEIGTTAADVDTYTDDGLTCETEYFYRVRAVRDSDVSDYSNTDSTTTLSCLEIALRTPRDGSATTSTRPNFRWQRNRDADRYRFELATDEDFTNLVLFNETPNNRRISYRVPRSDALGYGVYYWRVLADSGSGSFVPASEVRMLTVTPRLPRPPRQADPRNNARLNDPTPTLSWEAVSGAGDPFTYEIEIDDDARFRSPEISASVDGLSYSPAS